MPPVSSGMMAGNGKWKKSTSIFFIKFPCLNRWEEIGLILIGVHGEAAERNPRYTGYRVGIRRRKFIFLRQNAVISAIALLIRDISIIKRRKTVIILRPHQGKGFVILVEGGIERSECVVIAKPTVQFGDFKLHLLIQQLGNQP